MILSPRMLEYQSAVLVHSLVPLARYRSRTSRIASDFLASCAQQLTMADFGLVLLSASLPTTLAQSSDEDRFRVTVANYQYFPFTWCGIVGISACVIGKSSNEIHRI